MCYIHTCMCLYIYIQICASICTHTCAYVYIYIYIYTYVYTYVYTHIYIHICIYIYMYMCLYIYIHRDVRLTSRPRDDAHLHDERRFVVLLPQLASHLGFPSEGFGKVLCWWPQLGGSKKLGLLLGVPRTRLIEP